MNCGAIPPPPPFVLTRFPFAFNAQGQLYISYSKYRTSRSLKLYPRTTKLEDAWQQWTQLATIKGAFVEANRACMFNMTVSEALASQQGARHPAHLLGIKSGFKIFIMSQFNHCQFTRLGPLSCPLDFHGVRNIATPSYDLICWHCC